MAEPIRADDVRKAHELLKRAPEGDYREVHAQRALDKMADDYRFEGAPLEGESGADRDDAAAVLSRHGSGSFKQWMYGD